MKAGRSDHLRDGDPVQVLRRVGGVCLGSDLMTVCRRSRLRRALDEGTVVRLGHNRYALPGIKEGLAAAGQVNGVCSHLSAARYWGWKVKQEPEKPVVSVPRGRKVRVEASDIDLRWRQMPPNGVLAGQVTTKAQTVADCAATLDFDAALCVVDSALRDPRGPTSEQMIAAAEQLPRTGRSRALRVIRLGDRRAANPFESCTRAIALAVAGLEVTPQFMVDHIGQADLVDPRLRLVIEADSHEFHALKEAFRHDVRRYTAMVRGGWVVIRFCWEDVMYRPDYVSAVLVDLVAQLTPRRTVRRSAAQGAG
ncbi:MAG: endonuclease domain-containing protein [Nocardioides sp.]|nr:endonuclease domain-containing protein [Nocardioides sp.]